MPRIEEKTCTKCFKSLPLNRANFYYTNEKEKILSGVCINCSIKIAKKRNNKIKRKQKKETIDQIKINLDEIKNKEKISVAESIYIAKNLYGISISQMTIINAMEVGFGYRLEGARKIIIIRDKFERWINGTKN
ncbi:MAG: hypothetical protein GY870_08195 [archaeon]|nr:hypothetical protein [archaeon]